MNKFYLFVFIILLGCSTQGSKIYICGDHPCKNKKEVEDYFNNNISIEVYVLENNSKKKQNKDLVELNLSKLKEESFIDKKENKLTFLDKRKKNITNRSKKDKPSKLKLEVKTTEKEKKKKPTKDKNTDISNKTFVYKKSKSTKIVHMCKKIEECDIDLISKKINDLGKEKSFPDITYSKQ